MFGLKTFLGRFWRQLILKWGMGKSFLRVAIIILLLILCSVVVSVRVNPDWISDYISLLNLIGIVIVAVVAFVSGFIQIFLQVFLDYRAAQKSYRAFERLTNNSKRVLGQKPKGIPYFIPRDETQTILGYINNFRAVVLTGEAGTGKSGIAVDLLKQDRVKSMFCILIDARTLAGINTKGDLRHCFDIEESAYEVIDRLGKFVHTLLIVDQIDNIAGAQSCDVVIELLTTCSKFEGVSVVAISRRKEANEQGAIRPLIESGFIEVVCSPISKETIIQVLGMVGLENVSDGMLNLAHNLLNLDVICEIIQLSNIENLQNMDNEISLWEHYRSTFHTRENMFNNTGDEFIFEATRLAREGLSSIDRGFELDTPPTTLQRRLISGNIISRLAGRRYQFSHEKLQDYLYAWDACERNLMFDQVDSELGGLHMRNIILWMRDIYQARNDPQYAIFLEEVLSG